MTRDEAILRLKQIACCVTRANCDLCAYYDDDCVVITDLKRDGAYFAEELLKIIELLEADASAPAAPAPAEADPVNHPAHYTYGKHECIEEMEILFGREAVISYCRLAAYKYKYRAGHKDDAELDCQKADWYLDKAAELTTRNKKEVLNAHKQQEQGRKV